MEEEEEDAMRQRATNFFPGVDAQFVACGHQWRAGRKRLCNQLLK